MNNAGTSKIDRAGLTDAQYIAALELSNETMADEVYRLRQEILRLTMVHADMIKPGYYGNSR